MASVVPSLPTVQDRLRDLLAARGVLGMLYFYIDDGRGEEAVETISISSRERRRLTSILVECIEQTFETCGTSYFREDDFIVRGPRRAEWFVFLASPPRSRFGLTRRDLGEVERRVAREMRARLREALPRTGRSYVPPLRSGSAVLEHNPIIGIAGAIEEARHEARLRGEVERLLDDQLSGLNHKIRTPLTTIKGALDILRHDPEAAARFLPSLEQQVERMQHLLHQFSLLTRVRSGLFDWARQEVDLGEMTAALLQGVQPLLQEHAVTCQLGQPEEPIRVAGSLEILEEAVLQLVDNAVRHGGRGETIEVTVRAEGDSALLEVTDHGPGIPLEEQGNLFVPFCSMNSDPDAQSQGGGLGLALVQGIVEVHGGTVTCRSGVGKGTRMVVRLPLLRG